MSTIILAVGMFVLAAGVSLYVYPYVFRFAKQQNIVDNPNERKLQRVPVPVMGGVTVFAGAAAALIVTYIITGWELKGFSLVAMFLMLLVGMWDDVKDIPVSLRFMIEILVLLGFMHFSHCGVENFHGLWGTYDQKLYVTIPLSIVGGVGIINAMNLIDGVDGYSSGFAIVANICFAIMGFAIGETPMALFCLICAAAYVPFLLHNVFGKRTKMFIGDSGTLMLGMEMTVVIFRLLSNQVDTAFIQKSGIGMVAFALAVLAIPVFDTVRVMSVRVMRGKSPFHPDKTHLHHLFIEMGFSHAGTAVFIIFINTLVILAWLISWLCGASPDLQLYIVIALGILVTFVFYRYMKLQQVGGELDEDGYPKGSDVWLLALKIGEYSHKEKGKWWRKLTKAMDSERLGGKAS